jgi:hypothetical protein
LRFATDLPFVERWHAFVAAGWFCEDIHSEAMRPFVMPIRNWIAAWPERPQYGKGRDVTALLKSDIFRRFIIGFIIGTIGILALQSMEAGNDPTPTSVASSTGSYRDATL